MQPSPRRPSAPLAAHALAFIAWCALTLSTSAAPSVYQATIEPHWFSNNTQFWYRRAMRDGATEFVRVDADRGTRRPAFDHQLAAAALSKLTGSAVAPDHLPINALDYDAEPGAVLLFGSGKAWRLDLQTHEVRPWAGVPKPLAALSTPDRRPRSRESGEETSITFVNHSNAPVHIDWIDTRGKRVRYDTLPVGERSELSTYVGHLWVATDPAGRILGYYEAAASANEVLIEQPKAGATRPAPTAPRRQESGSAGPESPDHRWIAFVRADNLFLREKTGGKEYPLSDDGKPADAYSLDQLRWSPDSSHLAALRTAPAQEHPVYTVESSPKDQLQPKLRTLNYLKPGDRIAHARPRLFDVAARKQISVSEELFPNPWSISDLRWSADSSRFTFLCNQRGHQALRIVSVSAADGTVRAIVDERSETFIDYSGKYFCRWLGDEELIWMSERDGWNHLWLYDAKAGAPRNVIAPGDYAVQSIVRIDAEKRQLWFMAGGVRPGQDPYYAHLCRANFDGTALTVLTEGDGTHVIQWSPDEKHFIDTWSRLDQPPVHELRRADTGALACKLEEADASEVLADRGGRWPERFVAKGRDGVTNIYGMILFPRDFDPAKKYPVLENIYAGPQGFFTPKAFRARFGHQQPLADRGMIVVQCDGMGTSGRSKKFHDVCWKNLRDAGFPDRIAWIQAAAATHPQMDLSRVGIYGGSAGGQNALAALLWHPDFYKVAVADCGCHDNRMDKIWWNEQWMGWPIGPEYAANSNAVNAHLLQGKLMLIVGEMDDNVDPSSTLQVANALEKADKDFDLVIVTGAHHGAAETPYGSRRRADFLARNLLPPKATD